MSDNLALLRAIEANPDEDTPRLAYADWLDENAGSGVKGKQNRDWAARIRQDIAAARCPRTDPRYWDFPRGWQPVPTAAFQHLPKPLRTHARLDRGFPTRIGLSSRNFVASAKDIVACESPLIQLEVSQVRPHIEGLVKLPALTRFRELECSSATLTYPQYQRLFACKHLRQLTSLRLPTVLGKAALNDFAACGTFSNLRKLDLPVADDAPALAALFRSAMLTNLESLSLRGGTFTAGVGTALTESPHMQRLKSIHADSQSPQDSWLKAVAEGALPSLTQVYFGWYGVPGEGIAALLRSPRLRTMEFLSFRSTTMPPEAWAAVPVNRGSARLTLRYLPPTGDAAVALLQSPAISYCSMLDLAESETLLIEHLAALGQSKHAKHLRVLKADRRRGSFREENLAETLEPFAESPHLAGLHELDLKGHNLDDDAFDVLTRATFAGSLRALTLDGVFTAPSVRKFLKPSVFPNLKSLTMTVARTGNEDLSKPIQERIPNVTIQPRWWS